MDLCKECTDSISNLIINGVDRHFVIVHKYVQTEWFHIHAEPKTVLIFNPFYT